MAPQAIGTKIRSRYYICWKSNHSMAYATIFSFTKFFHGHTVRGNLRSKDPRVTCTTIQPVSMDCMGKHDVLDQHVVKFNHDPEIENKFLATIFAGSSKWLDQPLFSCPLPINLVVFIPWKRFINTHEVFVGIM